MSEGMGYFLGGIIGLLVGVGAWVGLFLWYFLTTPRYDRITLMVFLPFTPLGFVIGIVLTVTVLAAFFGGGVLGAALARHSMERD